MKSRWLLVAALAASSCEMVMAADGDRAPLPMLQAKSRSIPIDPARTALIVVDMQNDFGAKGGLFDLMGIDRTEIRKTVPPIASVLAVARQAGIKVIYLKMAFRPDLSDAGPPDSPNYLGHLRAGAGKTVRAPDGTESRVLIRDTWNTDIIDELKPGPGDVLIYKHRFSGFFETELDAVLKGLGIKRLIFTGCTTSTCVESTIRDAFFRDYWSVVLTDCAAEPMGADLARSNHDATLFALEKRFSCAMSTSTDFVKALGTPAIK